jgi:hypothetical protein
VNKIISFDESLKEGATPSNRITFIITIITVQLINVLVISH